EDDIAVAALGPAVELLQRRLEDAEDQPVDVAQHDGGKKQTADHPAQARAFAGWRCGQRFRHRAHRFSLGLDRSPNQPSSASATDRIATISVLLARRVN